MFTREVTFETVREAEERLQIDLKFILPLYKNVTSKFQLDGVRILTLWTRSESIWGWTLWPCGSVIYCFLDIATLCVYIIIIQQSSARGSLTPTERLTLKPKTFTLKDTWRAELVEIVVPSANHSAKQCRTPCAMRATCSECTSSSSECMWCSNMKQCVDSNAYVASFPFGQCMEWYTMNTCPRKTSCSPRLLWHAKHTTDWVPKSISCYYIISFHTKPIYGIQSLSRQCAACRLVKRKEII